MKHLSLYVVLFIAILNISPAIAYDGEINILAGDEIVTPQYDNNDSHFLLYNEGSTTYSVYMYNHTGGYKDSYVGSITTDQGIILNNNASYILYGDYNNMLKFGDADIILEKVFSWWNVIIFLIIIIIGLFGIYKIISRR